MCHFGPKLLKISSTPSSGDPWLLSSPTNIDPSRECPPLSSLLPRKICSKRWGEKTLQKAKKGPFKREKDDQDEDTCPHPNQATQKSSKALKTQS